MIPVYSLLRRSTLGQDLSLEQQRAEIGAWAERHGYTIVREFADTGSGLDVSRRVGFQALLAVCSDPQRRVADVVLCWDVSRFSRLTPDEAAFYEHSLRRAGVRVIFTHEPGANDEGLTGHLVKSMKRALAHDFSTKLSQTVRRGMRSYAERGGWTGGRPPYGYRRALLKPDGAPELLVRRKAKGERSTLVIDGLKLRSSARSSRAMRYADSASARLPTYSTLVACPLRHRIAGLAKQRGPRAASGRCCETPCTSARW